MVIVRCYGQSTSIGAHAKSMSSARGTSAARAGIVFIAMRDATVVVSVHANELTCLVNGYRKRTLDVIRNLPEASKSRVVASAMALVEAVRRIAGVHRVKFCVDVHQTFALTIVAVSAVAPFVARLAYAFLDHVDAVNGPKTLARIARFFGRWAARRLLGSTLPRMRRAVGRSGRTRI
jgi:hypothetical protein